jgi:hypothetical protein
MDFIWKALINHGWNIQILSDIIFE